MDLTALPKNLEQQCSALSADYCARWVVLSTAGTRRLAMRDTLVWVGVAGAARRARSSVGWEGAMDGMVSGMRTFTSSESETLRCSR
jgi:hypothetical protein